jgi:hypothetical protein
MYFGNVLGSDLALRGNNTTSGNPTNSLGAYSGFFVACSLWPASNNHSLCRWSREADNPKVNTNQGNSGNYSLDQNYRYGGRHFVFNLLSTNVYTSAQNAYGYTTPFSIQAFSNLTQTIPGYQCTSMGSRQGNIGTTATAAYGYQFDGYRLNNGSGTFLTATPNVNWYYNSSYGSVNMAYIKGLCVTWNVAGKPSDEKLKENIRLIGKSTKGTNIYTWSYKNPSKHGYGTYQGVMAQEVPYATLQHSEGYLMVDYSKVDVEFKKLYEGNLGFRER